MNCGISSDADFLPFQKGDSVNVPLALGRRISEPTVHMDVLPGSTVSTRKGIRLSAKASGINYTDPSDSPSVPCAAMTIKDLRLDLPASHAFLQSGG